MFETTSKTIKIEIVDGMAVIEGDIVLGPAGQFEAENAVAITGHNHRWPNGVIPYTIQSGHPKSSEIQWAIRQAIQSVFNRQYVMAICNQINL